MHPINEDKFLISVGYGVCPDTMMEYRYFNFKFFDKNNDELSFSLYADPEIKPFVTAKLDKKGVEDIKQILNMFLSKYEGNNHGSK